MTPAITEGRKLKVLDLFSGIGGFSLGLERTGGFETVAFCEIGAHRNKALGNAVVPQIPELIGKAILESRTAALPADWSNL